MTSPPETSGARHSNASELSMTRHTLLGVLLLFGIAAAYLHTMQWMVQRYLSPDSYYSHGFLIPIVSLFFIWNRRKELRSIEIIGSKTGALLIICAMLTHLLGTVLYVYSISGFSLYLYILGSVLFLFGRGIFVKLLFPLGFLLLMFPLPQAVLTAVSFPLKMIVAKIGVVVVRMMGIPILQEGFQLTIPAGQLLVGNPCSGLRSIISFLAIAAILAVIRERTMVQKVILIGSAIPIAMFANILRVLFLVLISHIWGLETAQPESFWHTASGVALFIIGLVMLFVIGNYLDAEKSTK